MLTVFACLHRRTQVFGRFTFGNPYYSNTQNKNLYTFTTDQAQQVQHVELSKATGRHISRKILEWKMDG